MTIPSAYCIYISNYIVPGKKNESGRVEPSVSDYNVKNVFKILEKSLSANLIEDTCYWSTELICSRMTNELIDSLFLYMSRNINISCSHCPSWMYQKKKHIKTLMRGNQDNYINNQEFRNNIAEIIAVLTSHKKNNMITASISNLDLRHDSIMNKLLSTDCKYIVNDIMKVGDPPEMRVAANEFANHLRKPGAMIRNNVCIMEGAVYWLWWMDKFNKEATKNIKEYSCANRHTKIVGKFASEYIWIPWEILRTEAIRKGNKIYEQVNALFLIFIENYSKVKLKKRFCHIVNATMIIIDGEKGFNNLIINNDNKHIIIQASANINMIYKTIKDHISRHKFKRMIKRVPTNNSTYIYSNKNNYNRINDEQKNTTQKYNNGMIENEMDKIKNTVPIINNLSNNNQVNPSSNQLITNYGDDTKDNINQSIEQIKSHISLDDVLPSYKPNESIRNTNQLPNNQLPNNQLPNPNNRNQKSSDSTKKSNSYTFWESAENNKVEYNSTYGNDTIDINNLNNYQYPSNVLNQNNEINRSNTNNKQQQKNKSFFNRFRKNSTNTNLLKSESFMRGDVKVIVTNY